MERTYFPVLMLLGFVALNAVMMLLLSHLTMRHRPTPVKQTPYESGIPPLGSAHERFSVKFYRSSSTWLRCCSSSSTSKPSS
jgi:NADH-quinone oxidoreductase subunit A